MPTSTNNQSQQSTATFFKSIANQAYEWIKSALRFLWNVATHFVNDDCYSKASALAFYTLLSIVPVLAVFFGIAKGFGFEEAFKEISNQFFQQPEIGYKLVEFAHTQLKNVQGGLIAGIGTLVLLWTVIGLLINVESIFNQIWKVKKGRSYAQKTRDYLIIFFIAPLFFIISSSLNIYLTQELHTIAQGQVFFKVAGSLLLSLLKLFPYVLSWMLFTFLYLFIPNTSVHWREGLIAGAIAGTAFQLWQWVYIYFQIGLASYGAIYGSFAAVPLFMIWLQVSWLIVLLGAEIAVEIENNFFMPNRKARLLSFKQASLLIVYQCIEAFNQGQSPLTDLKLARQLGMPLNHLHTILENLCQHKILAIASFGDEHFGYQPGRAVHNITIHMVCQAIDQSFQMVACPADEQALQKIEQLIVQLDKAAIAALENKSFDTLMKA